MVWRKLLCRQFSRWVFKRREGAMDLAQKSRRYAFYQAINYKPLYKLDLSIEEKIEKVCKHIYRAGHVEYSSLAREQIARYNQLGIPKSAGMHGKNAHYRLAIIQKLSALRQGIR
jgi:formyltetrahydrofolate synthetase